MTLGAILGFRSAQPAFSVFVGLGAAAIGLGLFAALVFVAQRLSVRVLWHTWLAPTAETRKYTVAAIGIGLLVGGPIGYAVGLQIAQAVYDLLAFVGVAAILALILAIAFALAKGQRRGRRRRSSRRYAGRRRR